jgi:hypothetical protein
VVGQDGLSKRKVMLVFFVGGVSFMEVGESKPPSLVL